LEEGEEEWAQLWSLFSSTDLPAWAEMLKSPERKEMGYLWGMNWLGDLNYFRPGKAAIYDIMHAFFRAVQSMTTTLISHLSKFGIHCKLVGQKTRSKTFDDAVLQVCKAKVGRAMYSKTRIIKRASSHVFNNILCK
jgi:hypothetical protein